MAKPTDLSDKTCVVTGASSGIGKVTAAALAEMGARTVMVCRDPARGEAARAEIAQRSGSDKIDLLIADVSSQRQVRQLASDISGRYDRLDVLVNNAGAMNTARTLTEDGIETTFAVNHLAYFLLTGLLLDMVKAGDGGRIVSVSSRAHAGSRINFDDIGGEQRFSGYRIYGQSKLANVLFTYELARRLDGSGVSANCLHPGVVATGFGHNNSDLFGRTFGFVLGAIRPFILNPERGAETSIYLASSPEVSGVSGKYFSSKKAIRSSPETYDEAAAQRLWRLSEDLTQPSAAT